MNYELIIVSSVANQKLETEDFVITLKQIHLYR